MPARRARRPGPSAPPRGARALSVVDTLTERAATVRPGKGSRIGLYVCGPTVYSAAHVGHARTFLYFDVARRFLEAEGFSVRHVMNVTDVEDKIDHRASLLGMSSRTLARAEERAFFRDLTSLGARLPHFRPRAGEYVPRMIEVGRALERTGRVRRNGDEWVYEPPDRPEGENFPTGRELAAHVVPEPGHRFGGGNGRERAILVWKLQEPPRPSWPSPWGRGVPGWHLECFAMASELLGVPVDLHGGARDLIYPHHYAENEIALALRGSRFSRVFLHTGFVLQGGTKMARSTGNLAPLRSAIRAAGAGTLRWYLLGRSFHDRLPWHDEELLRAKEAYGTVRGLFSDWVSPGAGGRVGAASARRLLARTRSALGHGLRFEAVIPELERLAEELARSPSSHAPRGERREVRELLGEVERRTGLPLL